MKGDPGSVLTYEMATAKYHSPMAEHQMQESWWALRREMLRDKWAKAHGLSPEEVGVVVNSKTRKAFFQWKPAILFLDVKI